MDLVAKASTMRERTEGRKLEWAPWRSSEPTSSSSKRATSLICEEEAGEVLRRAWMAAHEQSLSSMRPAKMNSLERPPS